MKTKINAKGIMWCNATQKYDHEATQDALGEKETAAKSRKDTNRKYSVTCTRQKIKN